MRALPEALDEDSHQQHADEDRNAIYQKFLWKSQLVDHRIPNPPGCFFRTDLDIDLLG